MAFTTESASEHEFWIQKIRRVDRLLENSIPTLIRIAQWAPAQGLPSVPLFISERTPPPPRKFILVHAICASTIQRVFGVHRRFGRLTAHRAALQKLATDMPRMLMPGEATNRTQLPFLWELGNDLFGAVNPLTSSEVFWSLIRAGERAAHSSLGFLAFFGIAWALGRRYPDKNETGAGLEPSGPTATTTAKCLIAIHSLMEALRQRSRHYKRAAKLVVDIDKVVAKSGPRAAWEFASQLDLLAGTFFELSPYTIISDDFINIGKFILEQTEPINSEVDLTKKEEMWIKVRDRIRSVLGTLDTQQKVVFADSRLVVSFLLPKVIAHLAPGASHAELKKFCLKLDESGPPEYWQDHQNAAKQAASICGDSLDMLQAPFASFTKLQTGGAPPAPTLAQIFLDLAKSNDDVRRTLDAFVAEPVAWCRRIIDEETARARAGNLTDFDPAGLISAITVAQKWNTITRLEAEAAIATSLQGALSDGSWMRGQPMFLEARVLGVWPHTPDVVWMLAVAVNSAPNITAADDKLMSFVDWLERTQTRFKWNGTEVRGWSSELDRIPNIIDLWNTCVSINALLEIRELIEMRLWQLCQRRFTEIQTSRWLTDIDPVDLGAAHGKRLHRRLMTMARLTELEETYDEQPYALVLHGPPGSSKTAIVEGLGREMWRANTSRPRLIRITPSDFTRQGEERLDSEARFIFELLTNLRGVTILFDEIDDFLRRRDGTEKPSFIQLIIPAMLNRLQDLRDAAPRQEICFILATNFVDKIEPALLRPGRIDAVIPVSYPDVWSRHAILERVAAKVPITEVQREEVVSKTAAWPWSTFNKLIKELRRIAEHGATLDDNVIAGEIATFADTFERADYYYRDRRRWRTGSAALANEYVHLAFCTSKDLGECLKEALKLKDVDAKTITEMFDRQRQAEART